MKIAHLILTHKNPAQLGRLLNALDHPSFDFFIHIDKKVDAGAFAHFGKQDRVFFIENRASVFWAAYGTIQATINAFREILTREYDYINVISAQDFPLKPPAFIYEYINSRAGTEFITCESIDEEWKEAAPRVRQYHFVNWRIPGKYRLAKLANKILPPRKFPLDYKIVGRANWFTITREAARYILEFEKDHPEVVRYFRYCWGADEFFFASILYNSRFKNQIVNNLVYVDWSAPEKPGHPKILVSEDLNKLKSTDKLFGRKFDYQVDPTIFGLLEEWIHLQSQSGPRHNHSIFRSHPSYGN